MATAYEEYEQMCAELDTLRKENQQLTAERDRLRGVLTRIASGWFNNPRKEAKQALAEIQK